MNRNVLVAGGGIAGMAAGFAVARAGWQPTVFERSAEFSEVGAGVQLGPNVTRILQAWGLDRALQQVAFYPSALRARSMRHGDELATLPLNEFEARYGAPYVTLHRADLHGLLMEAALREGVQVQSGAVVERATQVGDSVALDVLQGAQMQAHMAALAVAADGIWSPLRQQILGDGLPAFTGHIAYRALVKQADLPAHLRSQDVTVWMGSKAHVVSYPVRAGDCLTMKPTVCRPCKLGTHKSPKRKPWRSCTTHWVRQVRRSKT
jgi:salicylate hydroxylase